MKIEQVCGECGGYQVVDYDPESDAQREQAQLQLTAWTIAHRHPQVTVGSLGSDELRGL